MTLYYADLRLAISSEGKDQTVHIACEAPSFSVAVAQIEAWAAGFYTGFSYTKPSPNFKSIALLNVTSGRKPKGHNYHRLSDSAAIYEELTK